MNQMYVEDRYTNQKYEVTDVEPSLTDDTTGKKELTFSYTLDDDNKLAYNALTGRNFLYLDERVHKKQKYFIRGVQVIQDGEMLSKTITASHIYVMRLQGNRVDEIITGTQSLENAIKHALKGSGFTYEIKSDAKGIGSAKLDSFGDKSSLELMDEIISYYEVELDVNNTKIYVYKKMGKKINKTLDVRANVQGIQIDISEDNTTTRARGYGKQKEDKDILSNTTLPYASKTGEWSYDSSLSADYTKKIGATFTFTFTGTGFRFKTIVSKFGGYWTFKIGDTSKKLSMYKDVDHETKTFDVIRGLAKKEYKVVATFSGRDSNNPNTKSSSKNDPVMYLLRGDIIEVYREFANDDEKYVFPPVLFVHPNEKDFLIDGQPTWAETVRDDTITTDSAMTALLKKKVNPFPEVALDVDFEEFNDPKLAGIEDEITKGDTLHIIADTERNGTTFEDDVRVVSMTYNPLNDFDKPEITFTNFRKDIYDINTDNRRRIKEQQRYLQTQKDTITQQIEAAKQEMLAEVERRTSSFPSTLTYTLEFNGTTWAVTSANGEVTPIGSSLILNTDDDLQVVYASIDVTATMKQSGYIATIEYTGTETNRFTLTLMKNGVSVDPITVPIGSKIYVVIVAFK
ncbi:phage tail protein [Bacillus sp. SPB7]|nr:phage tail protein [Bacillus rugosus]